MDTSELTLKILDIFPNVTFKTDTKHGNIRVHFKADTHNFVPSKWLFCNALELPEDKVSVSMKRFNEAGWNCDGKLFIIHGGLYL